MLFESDNSDVVDDTDNDKDFVPGIDSSSSEIGVGAVRSCDSSPRKRRKKNKGNWKRNIKKSKRNSGEGIIFKNEDCRCPMRCSTKVSDDDRLNTFLSFWKLGNFSKQNIYICGLVKRFAVKQRRKRDGTRQNKSGTNKYYLNIKNESVHVCKQYFLKTFEISDGRMTRALNKDKEGKPGEDLRGKSPSVNKICEDDKNYAKNHILSFPAYTSHYTRHHNPNRKYLSSDLNVRKMFKLYQEKCLAENKHAISESKYRHIFFEQNLYFHAPLKDTCQLCDKLKMQINVANETEKNVIKAQHELHLRKAEKARQSMKDDTQKAKENPQQSFHVVSFDLQKALPFPTITTSIAYYKRNMYTYNLGVHDLTTNKSYMYVWNETIASRGSQEIGSCLAVHVRSQFNDKKHLIAYSDTCTGQNRNKKLALTWMKLLIESTNSLEIIDHKFMVSGHSFMKNDSDFGNIEVAAKNKTHYVPNDWYETIRTARKKNTFKVYQMKQEEFKSTAQLEKAVVKKKKNTAGTKVNWLQIQWMRFVKDEPHKMFYKLTLEEEMPFDCLDFPLNKNAKHTFAAIKQRKLYTALRPVTVAKKNDMVSLLPYIPPIHHDFFNSLTTSNGEDMGPLEDIEEEEADIENNDLADESVDTPTTENS